MIDAKTSADLYRANRERVSKAVVGLDPADLDRQVPACPQWSVHNLVSHLSGAAVDFGAGNLAGAPLPPWTAVQVQARQNLPIDAVLAEWATAGPALERLILSGTTSHPFVCNPYVDGAVHEADLHGAVGTGRPPVEAWLAALDWMLSDADGPLTVITPDGTFRAGSDEPVATVHTSSYEFFRALFGRRSPEQIQKWDWESPEHAALWSVELARLPQTPKDLTD
ncbi:maleylpyruvate isomerase N-terminal domain-containing protein [Kribbella sp. NPDC051952]|uniref:maleylpyruvate isomerase N-terminal domain-containing protein n=1 Tax=Kribbella sp. NPDC051952 TaxID=3154851 RepID=UPI003436FA76